MSLATSLRWLVLGFVVIFVGYFGVWQLYFAIVNFVGDLWATIFAGISAFGLVIILIVGTIMIRTKEILDEIE